MTEVPKDFTDLSTDINNVDKRVLLSASVVGVLGAVGLAGLIYKLVSEKNHLETDEHLVIDQETHEDL